jgi:hypothetical protein
MTVTLGETKVNAIDKVSIPATTVRDKVGRLDITVNQVT